MDEDETICCGDTQNSCTDLRIWPGDIFSVANKKKKKKLGTENNKRRKMLKQYWLDSLIHRTP